MKGKKANLNYISGLCSFDRARSVLHRDVVQRHEELPGRWGLGAEEDDEEVFDPPESYVNIFLFN